MEIFEILNKCSDLEHLGQYMQAINVLKQALLRFPTNTDLLVRLGKCYHHLERYEDAKACYKKALIYDPFDSMASAHLERIKQGLPVFSLVEY